MKGEQKLFYDVLVVKDIGVGCSPGYKCKTHDPFIMIRNGISIHYDKKLHSSASNGKKIVL